MTPCRQLDLEAIRWAAKMVATRHHISLGSCPIDREDLEQEACLRILMGRQSVSGPMQDLLRDFDSRTYKPVFLPLREGKITPSAPERAIPRLPDLRMLRIRTRLVLYWRYFLGWRYARIGEALGIKQSAAKRIETRGIEQLRKVAFEKAKSATA